MASMSIPSLGISGIIECKTSENPYRLKLQSGASSFFGRRDFQAASRVNICSKSKKVKHVFMSIPTRGPEEMVQEDDCKGFHGPSTACVASANDPTFASSLREPSALNNIEHRAQQSIDKLKHILYRLKTRPVVDEGISGISKNLGFESALPNIKEEKEVYVSHKLKVDLNSENQATHTVVESLVHGNDQLNSNVPIKRMFQEDLTHFDSLTCTRTTVQFDDKNKTAIVTVTATVRAADLEMHDASTEKTIALAARALTRTCLSFEKQAQADLCTAIAIDEPHVGTRRSEKSILEQLANGKVIGAVPARHYGEVQFRPTYEVTLSSSVGKQCKALFKPMMPGDGYGRWQHAPPEWVAFHVSSLLGVKLVPPAVIRKGVDINGKKFASGVMIYLMEDIKPLSSLPPKEWRGVPEMVVSNAHVLDALIGNAPREAKYFFAARDWLNTSLFRPVLLEHPMGPNLGDLHSMWSERSAFSGLRTVSPDTLVRLRNMKFAMLVEIFGEVLTAQEISMILQRKKQILAYFDAMASRNNSKLPLLTR